MVDPGILVGTGGVVGALLRHLVYELTPSKDYPLATLIVNVLGSFVLGIVMFAELNEGPLLFVGVGVCGAFTTYSTFAVDTVRLWLRGDIRDSIAHAVLNLVVSLGAVGVAGVMV